MAVWSSSFAAIRFALPIFDPGPLALFRFIVASACFVPFARGFRRPAGRDLLGLAAIGFLSVPFYQILLITAETRVSAGSASLIIALVPGLTAVLARIWYGEALSRFAVAGTLVAFLGVGAVTFGTAAGAGPMHFEPRALLILGAVLSAAVIFIAQRPLIRRVTVTEYAAYSIWLGTAMLLVYLPGLIGTTMGAIDRRQWAEIATMVYLGVGPTALGYALWVFVLAHRPAGQVTGFLYLQPLLAHLIAWVWLGERPSLLSVTGGALILGGVVLITRPRLLKKSRNPADVGVRDANP